MLVETEEKKERNPNFVVSADLFNRFRKTISQQGVSMAKTIEQFLESYVHCLDSSFVHDTAEKKRRNTAGKAFRLIISLDIYRAFAEKVRKENGNMNCIVAQFMKNYVAFINDNTLSTDKTEN